MKSNQSALRLRRFDVDEKRRNVSDIEAMIADFERMCEDLERQIDVEQSRAGITDINHYNYPTFAKAALQRRDNLLESIQGLSEQLDRAREALADAEDELSKLIAVSDVADPKSEHGLKRQSSKFATLPSVAPVPMSARGA